LVVHGGLEVAEVSLTNTASKCRRRCG
jgi:hypothetical protein